MMWNEPGASRIWLTWPTGIPVQLVVDDRDAVAAGLHVDVDAPLAGGRVRRW